MAVHVLRALTRQGGATGGGPDHESPGELVTGSPHGVAGALEAEHRVEHVDRNHGFAVGGVGGPGGGEGRHRTGLVDAGVEDLAVGGLPVAEEQVRVDGRVLLAAGVVDLDGREEGVDTEGASLVGDDGHHARRERLVAHQVLEQAHEGHGGGHLLLAGTLADGFVGLLPRQRDELAVPTTFRHVAAERAATFLQVLHPRVLRPGLHVWRAVGIGLEHGVGDRHMNPVAERLEIVEGHLLHLVRGVAAREVLTQEVALDRVGEDDRGRPRELGRRLVRGVDLVEVVAAAGQRPDLVVCPVLHHGSGAGVAPEEVFAHIGAVIGLEGLVVAVRDGVHQVDQGAFAVRGEQRIPPPAPDQFDDVPARAPEEGLEFLDDLAVAAHRPVETLQVAVDHEGQVVEFLVGGQLQQAAGLGLVHLAVTQESPDALLGGVLDAAVLQVAVELRLVDGVHGADAHGDRRELPEVLHLVGVRVTGQGPHLSVDDVAVFLTESVQVRLLETPFQEGPGVHARRSVPLEEHLIAPAGVVLASEEVVHSHLVEGRSGSIGGDMPSDTDAWTLGAVHGDGCIPTQQPPDLAF